jgi:ketosteroid isomerase-like protein
VEVDREVISVIERLEPVGADRILALLRVSATGRASGISAGADALSATGGDMPTATVYDLADGRVRRIRVFLDRAEAFEAVGLREQAMSQENVEIVRESLSAFADRGLDGLAAFWDAGISWRAIEGAPDDVGEMHGPEAVRRYLQDWIDMFDDVTNVAEEVLDLGDNRVVAVQRATGRAKASGVQTNIRYAVVYTLRDGKIVRGREYIDRGQALKALSAEGGVRPPAQNLRHW